MSWQTTPDQTLVNGIEKTIPRSRWNFTLVIDVIVFSLLAVRPYSTQPHQMLVIHYYGFLIASDLIAYFLSERRRFWYFVFVFSGSAGLLQSNIQIYLRDLDGGQDEVSLLRIFFILVRLINAALCVRSYGPWLQHWVGIYNYARKLYEASGKKERSFFRRLIKDIFSLFILVPFAYSTHWNYGENGLDGPLIALQANAAFSFRTKVLIFTLLIAKPRTRGFSLFAVCALSVFSWVLMPRMYFSAPTTFVPHLMADLQTCKMTYDAFNLASPGAPFDAECKTVRDSSDKS